MPGAFEGEEQQGTIHVFTILGRVPSKKNSLRRIQRGTRVFTVSSEAHKQWHEDALWQLPKRFGKPITACSVTVTFYPPDRNAGDLSNKAESVMDALVDAGILADDNWFIVGDLRLRFGGVDKANPRAEIELVVHEHGPAVVVYSRPDAP